MLSHLFQSVDAIIHEYGYLGIGVIVTLENAGLPIPGETSVLLGGAFAARGDLSLGLVIMVAAIAAVIGDNVGFLVGRSAGHALVIRFGAKFGLNADRYAKAHAFFTKWGGPGIFVARFLPVARVAMAPVLGSVRYPWAHFVIWQVAGAILWATVISFAGYYGLVGAHAAHLVP